MRFFLALALSVIASTTVLASRPAFKRVVVVVLENTNFQDAIKQPYLRQLMQQGSFLDHYAAISHPSLPNYLGLVAGDDFDISDDAVHSLNERHLGDLLDAKNRSWKTYAEDYPGGGFIGTRKNQYARKHLPFLSFRNMLEAKKRCAQHLVPAEQLDTDVASGNLPDFALYIPNMNNDGHDTGVAAASQWLEKRFGPLLKNPKFMKDNLFVVTFDENAGAEGNLVLTILKGDSVKAGGVSHESYTHYSLLKTVEDHFELGTLGRKDAKAQAIDHIWK